MTYVPPANDPRPGTFKVQPTGGRALEVSVTPRPEDENGATSCRFNPTMHWYEYQWSVYYGNVTIQCDDEEGDALTATLTTAPVHGQAQPAYVADTEYGTQVFVPYVPDPGFSGRDHVDVEVTDGHGFRYTFAVDIVLDASRAPMPLPAPRPVRSPRSRRRPVSRRALTRNGSSAPAPCR